jgi:hypothetical protein
VSSERNIEVVVSGVEVDHAGEINRVMAERAGVPPHIASGWHRVAAQFAHIDVATRWEPEVGGRVLGNTWTADENDVVGSAEPAWLLRCVADHDRAVAVTLDNEVGRRI